MSEFVLVELHDASDVPSDDNSKYVFSMSGNLGEGLWIAAYHNGAEWVDDNGHAIVNVVYWCELPHPSNLIRLTAQTVYTAGATKHGNP